MSYNGYSRNTRPTWAPRTTSKKAKGEYKKHGPRLSSQEARQLDRRLELESRARKIKDAEERKKANARKRAEKEEKHRQAQKNGGGSYLPKFPSSQVLLEHFMKRPIKLEGVKNSEECIVEKERLEDIPDARDSSDEIYGTPIDEYNVINEPKPEPPTSQKKRKQTPEPERATQKRSLTEIAPNMSVELDDFCVSNTQIAREILDEPVVLPPIQRAPRCNKLKNNQSHTITLEQTQDSFLDMLSTQDVALSADDIEELASAGRGAPLVKEPCQPATQTTRLEKKVDERLLMPPPRIPFKPVRPTQSLHTLPRKRSMRSQPRVSLSLLCPNTRNHINLRESNSKENHANAMAVVESQASSAVELDSLLQADFVLSTQDQRDIFG